MIIRHFYLYKYILLVILTYGFKLEAQVINVPNINSQLTIDGNVTENAWIQAHQLNNFKQLEPSLGADATEIAIVKVMCDDRYLYVSGVAYFSDPSQVFATTLERDIAQVKDDYIEIHLDTYNDKTNTLVFRTNPLGARQDFEISRNGEAFNTSWNTFWTAASKINANSWSMEMRIPFSSLRYQKANQNLMRIKAIIKYKEKMSVLYLP